MFKSWFVGVYKKTFMVPKHKQKIFTRIVNLTSAEITDVYESYSLQMMMFCVSGPYDSLELICEKIKNEDDIHMFYKSIVVKDEEES